MNMEDISPMLRTLGLEMGPFMFLNSAIDHLRWDFVHVVITCSPGAKMEYVEDVFGFVYKYLLFLCMFCLQAVQQFLLIAAVFLSC